jgi:SAM-dependent methyltransferase
MANSEHRQQHEHGHGHTQGHGHAHEHSHGGEGGGDDASMAEVLDLDAEVLRGYLSEVTGWVERHAGPGLSGRILDLGCGTGTGTFALLRQNPDAEVVAVDGSEFMLERLREKARGLGVEKRVHTVRANLDEAWPDLGTVDVVWTSAFMHHLADPDRALQRLFDTLRPGGLLVVIEMDGFPRFLPDGVGDGLEERCLAAVAEINTQVMPHWADDWAARLTDAGFTIEEARTFSIEIDAPVPEAAARYARASLGRLRPRLADVLSGEDLATLDTLLDPDRPESLARREDLSVRARRFAWAARRR